MRINVSRVHSDMCVIVSCAWHRCLSVLVMLRHARDGDFLPPGVASTIHGKLGFIFSAAYGRVGRAAAQPLVQRSWFDTDTTFSPALAHMLAFFEALLPQLPSLQIPIHRRLLPPDG